VLRGLPAGRRSSSILRPHVEYIVAVTSWGDSVCKSTNNNYRVDLESSRSFIDDMIALTRSRSPLPTSG